MEKMPLFSQSRAFGVCGQGMMPAAALARRCREVTERENEVQVKARLFSNKLSFLFCTV